MTWILVVNTDYLDHVITADLWRNVCNERHIDGIDRNDCIDCLQTLSEKCFQNICVFCDHFEDIEDMEAIGSDSSDLGVCDDMSGDNAVTNGSVDVKDSTGSLDMTQRFKTSLVVSQTTPSSESSLEFSKDSFDRFGDDLCRLLLSYLPFEEHFRRECLSKQFQRCLHISLDVLTITVTLWAKIRAKSRSKSVSKSGSIRTDILTDILKKCANIQTIDCYHNDISYKWQILEAIDGLSDDYCRRLTRIDLCFNDFDDSSINWFQRFGPKLHKLTVQPSNSRCLQYCHHLRHLSVQTLTDVFTPDNRLMTQKLISFRITDNFSNDKFATFVANNKSLNSLYVSCRAIPSMPAFRELMAQIASLPQLRRLTLYFSGAHPPLPHSLYDSLRIIGTNCRQLTRFSLQLMSNSWKLNVDAMNAMIFMPRLRHLFLDLGLIPDAEMVTDFRMFDAIYGCKRLTYLRLHLWQIYDTLLADIETNHRKLQVLYITTTDKDIKYNESDVKTFIMRCSHKLSAFSIYESLVPGICFNEKQIYEMRHNLTANQ